MPRDETGSQVPCLNEQTAAVSRRVDTKGVRGIAEDSTMARPTALLPRLDALLLVGTFLFSTGSLGAQTTTFEGEADVLTVEVPVHVVDRKGVPIRGLTVDDFELLDEGVAQSITGFRRIEISAEASAGVQTGGPADDELPPPAARRRLLLLFDLAFSKPSAIGRARDAARSLVLERLHPSDLVGVATYSTDRGVQLLMNFSPDRGQVARAIDALSDPESLRLLDNADPLRFVLDPGRDSFATGPSPNETVAPAGRAGGLGQEATTNQRIIGERFARAERAFAAGRITAWTRALGDLASFLGNIDGRKNVLLFSEGFDGRLLLGRRPSTGGESLAERQQVASGQVFRVDSDQAFGNPKLQGDVNTMLNAFQRADSVIQAVDIDDVSVDGGRRDRGVGRDAMFYMANETGGALLTNTNDLGVQLNRALRPTEVTYLLAFDATDRRGAGTFHRLRVKGPKGARLFHRAGYVEPEAFDSLHPIEKALLAGDAIATLRPDETLGLDVLAVPFRASTTTAYVPVLIEVSGQSLLVGNDPDNLEIEIYAYATNRVGEIQGFFTDRVHLELRGNRHRFERSGLKYYGKMDLGPGGYRIRTLVRNALTGASGLAATELNVPDYTGAGPVLLPPLFFEAPGQWVMVRGDADDGIQRESVVYPFTVNGNPYVPDALPEVGGSEEAWLCLVGYDLGDQALFLEGTVLGEGGTPVEGATLSLVERTVTGIEGMDKLLASFRADTLPAGRYTLEVAVTDDARVSLARSMFAFQVKEGQSVPVPDAPTDGIASPGEGTDSSAAP